jgi:hypothetical protein
MNIRGTNVARLSITFARTVCGTSDAGAACDLKDLVV